MILPGDRVSLGVQNEQGFLEFVQSCFHQKRKTLWNNLRDSFSNDLLRNGLAASEVRAEARAEQLSLAQFASLFKHLVPGSP